MHEFENLTPLTPVLCLRCLVRDEQAWSSLSAYYQPMLAAYACRLLSRCRGDPDGEQIACDVLERLFHDDCRLLRAFDQEKSFKGYLRMLARSNVRLHKSRPRKDDCHELLTDGIEPALLDERPWQEQLEDLRQVLTKAQWKLVQKCLSPQTEGCLASALNDAGFQVSGTSRSERIGSSHLAAHPPRLESFLCLASVPDTSLPRHPGGESSVSDSPRRRWRGGRRLDSARTGAIEASGTGPQDRRPGFDAETQEGSITIGADR